MDFLEFHPKKRQSWTRAGKTLLGFLVFFLVSCDRDGNSASGDALNMSLKTYAGNSVALHNENEVTLLVFWATWCQPCIMEIPSLMTLHEKYRSQGFNVVSINVDDPEGTKVSSISKSYGINYPVLVGDEEVMKRFGGITSLPTSFLIGRDGKIKEKIQGLYPEQHLERMILGQLETSDKNNI